jgi:hypothetical protein
VARGKIKDIKLEGKRILSKTVVNRRFVLRRVDRSPIVRNNRELLVLGDDLSLSYLRFMFSLLLLFIKYT